MDIDDWFLTADERGNPWTRLDLRHPGRAYSPGNAARFVLHGADFFARLRDRVEAMDAGDLLLFTDWRGDPDERLDDSGVTVADLLNGSAERGVRVRGLCWRSHLDVFRYSEKQNRTLADGIRHAGGECGLDMRVLPLGSHHQKMVILRHPDRPERDVAWVGGIDMCWTRRDTREHRGDPQAVSMAAPYMPTPPWHDAMVELTGPAVGDIEASFRERWEDPTPLTYDLISKAQARLRGDETRLGPLPDQLPDPEPTGTLDVQVLRTYPPKKPRFPFAPSGERSVARGFGKAVANARRLLLVEDQYFWSPDVTACFARALAANPELRMILVLPLVPTSDGALAVASTVVSRVPSIDALQAAGGDRVAVYGIENPAGTPVYVHTKVCVVDDTWTAIGSANINRRSWTYDSELSVGIHDATGGFGRDVRLTLAAEHLDRPTGDGLEDAAAWFDAFADSAARLDTWYAGGRVGERPPGRLRTYRCPPQGRVRRALGRVVYGVADDPDARPRELRGTDRF